MKIVDMKVRCVAIPLSAQLRHNTGVHPGYFLRTILELVTDEGIVGLGEVGGGDQRGALTKLKSRIIGMDPFHLELIKLKTLRAIYYLSNARLYAAIEMACLDIQGKALGRPLCDLIGGAVRDRIPMIAYLFWRYDRPGGGHDEHPEDMADLCQELHETLGVTAMKLKAGVLDPNVEARAVELCRDRMGNRHAGCQRLQTRIGLRRKRRGDGRHDDGCGEAGMAAHGVGSPLQLAMSRYQIPLAGGAGRAQAGPRRPER